MDAPERRRRQLALKEQLAVERQRQKAPGALAAALAGRVYCLVGDCDSVFCGSVCDEPVSEIYGTCGGAVWTGCPGICGCNRNLQASVQEDVR